MRVWHAGQNFFACGAQRGDAELAKKAVQQKAEKRAESEHDRREARAVACDETHARARRDRDVLRLKL